MTPTAAPPLHTTALHALHQHLGARMVAFAGYHLPVHYRAGVLAEHRHTRQQASVFDVSHMGQLRIHGPEVAAALERLLPVDVQSLAPDRQRYALLLQTDGGILDDVMLLRTATAYYLVVNAAHTNTDLAWLRQQLGPNYQVEHLHDQSLLALQGPQAEAALQRLVPACGALRFMHGMAAQWQDTPLYLTRSGYTGEDGFEISVSNAQAEALVQALLAQPGVQMAGLGARNSLRLEAGLCLMGQDMDAGTTPVEAALGWSISAVRRAGGARAGGFVGAERVLAQSPTQASRLRVGLQALERIPVRDGTPLHAQSDLQDPPQGYVTSGVLSPTLDVPIAMAYLPPTLSAMGQQVYAHVRGKPVPMQVCAMPFVPTRYRRASTASP